MRLKTIILECIMSIWPRGYVFRGQIRDNVTYLLFWPSLPCRWSYNWVYRVFVNLRTRRSLFRQNAKHSYTMWLGKADNGSTNMISYSFILHFDRYKKMKCRSVENSNWSKFFGWIILILESCNSERIPKSHKKLRLKIKQL